MNKLRCWSLQDFNQHSYAVIGNGGFVQILMDLLKQHQLQLPVQWLEAADPTLAVTAPDYLILGTDTFQLEIIERWAPYLKQGQKFVDVSDLVQCVKFGVPLPEQRANPPQVADLLFCGIGTALSEALWLYPVRQQFQQGGVSWQAVHPLEQEREALIQQAKAVVVWNGSQRIFQEFLTTCQRFHLPVTYAECGFFPQSEHFYFDREGVNLASALRHDELAWLGAEDDERIELYRHTLFQGRVSQNQGYVFVPLQIGSDSNVQNHSRFRQGMQHYIDFILSQHRSDELIFKVHPKDQYADHYQFYGAAVSSADTLDLIAGAALVRGINSSVLFEAALFGKQVKADGECLLNSSKADAQLVVKAMIARQYRTSEFELNQAKLARFSNLGHLFYD